MSTCQNDSGGCADTLFLPILPYEDTWNDGVRAFLYFAGLLFCFMGVSIVADVFMGSIEKITSKTRKIYLSKNNKHNKNDWRTSAADGGEEPESIEVNIWNGTVANLTLMALGSSAPEILLAIIEVVKNNFKSGDLGPGTIVGSAAFNLLAITAVCVIAIPSGEGRSIRLIKVFWVTSIFSFFAYVWLLIVLEFVSPNVVELWEAILTFLFFPILVILAWFADRDFKWGKRRVKKSTDQRDNQIELGVTNNESSKLRPNRSFHDSNGDLIQDELIEFYKNLRKYPYLTDIEAATLAAAKLMETKARSRLWYRIGAIRDLGGSRKIEPKLTKKLQVVYDAINSHPDLPDIGPAPGSLKEKSHSHHHQVDQSIVEFHAASYAVPENVGDFKVAVIRRGRMDNSFSVLVESFDGTAKQGSDYLPVNQKLIFGPNVKEQEVTVRIVDDNQYEPDEEFFLRLSLLNDLNVAHSQRPVALGRLPIMEVIILDDDEPGILSFRKRGLLVKESCGFVNLEVERTNGADGEIVVKWRTIDGTAKSPADYLGGEGTLTFKHGETLRSIEIPIVDDLNPEKDECFEVELLDGISGGAKLGRITKVAVTISNDDDFNSVLQRWTEMTSQSLKTMTVHQDTYRSQIYDAVTVNGGNIEEATGFDYFMHIITFFWKVLFSIIPPPAIWGGYACFFCSLAAIGLLTALIGDLATIFGCLVGLKDSVTAITFVALGTSLPDLFASKTAASKEKYADNAIGNVTGSNSVNVFLGLGLPWVMAAIYWESKGQPFEVESGPIAFSVLVYSIVAFLALTLIMVRRHLTFFGKTELGGPTGAKWATGIVLVGLWIIYIVLSSLQAYCFIEFNL